MSNKTILVCSAWDFHPKNPAFNYLIGIYVIRGKIKEYEMVNNMYFLFLNTSVSKTFSCSLINS